MKKSVIAIIGVVVVVLVVVGIIVFGGSSKPKSSSSNTGSTVAAVNDGIVVTKTNSSLGSYLAEPNGQALYTYNGDSSGVSKVTGSLLASWPAYQDTGSTSGLPAGIGTIKRTDNGEIQYTYNGMPLYTFVADSNGQVTGNGVSNFSVAKPAASTSSSSSTTTTSTGSSTSSTSGSSSAYPY